MNSNILDDILRFTKDELLAESERRGLTVPHEKTKMEIGARILEDNSRQALEQSTMAAKEEVSTTDLLRIVHQMLAQPKYSGKLISTPDLSHTLPTFAGRDEDTLKEWLSAVEAMRLQYEWEDATVLAIAQNKLRSAAKDWNEGAGRKIKSWEEWKVELTKQFGYEVTVLTWSDRCKARVQGEEENIVDYMHSKMKMIERCPVQLRERDKVDYLVVGVREKSVSSGLLAHFKAIKCDCYALIELARDLEPRVRGKDQEKNLKRTDEYETKTQDKKLVDASDSETKGESDKKVIRCFRCHEVGHFGRDHDDPFKAKKLPPTTKYPVVKRENNYSDRDGQRGSKTVCALLYKEEFRSKHPTRPVISIRANDHIVDALLDSGADITVVRSDEAEDMGLLVRPWNKPNVKVVGADSHPKGVAKITVEIGTKSAVVEAAVVDQTPYPVLVGSDWKNATNTGIMTGPGRRVIIEGENEQKEAIFLSLFLLEEEDKSHGDSGEKTTGCDGTDPHDVHKDVGRRHLEPELTDAEESKLPAAMTLKDEHLLSCEQAQEQIWINSIDEKDTTELVGMAMLLPNDDTNRAHEGVEEYRYLKDMKSKVAPDATPERNVILKNEDLQELNLRIHHRSGKSNVVADAFSRIPDKRTLACLMLTAENSRLASAQKSDAETREIFDILQNEKVKGRRAAKKELKKALQGQKKRRPKLYRVKKILPNEICELEAMDGSEERRAHSTQVRKYFEGRDREDGLHEIKVNNDSEINKHTVREHSLGRNKKRGIRVRRKCENRRSRV